MTNEIKKSRRGRKPGAWKDGLTAETLRAFRKDYGLSRAVAARLLSVSATTIQNWELESAIPTPKSQDALEQLVKDAKRTGVVPGAPPVRRGSMALGAGGGETLTATGQIVVAYMGTTKVTQDGLVELIRAVRSALDLESSPRGRPPGMSDQS